MATTLYRLCTVIPVSKGSVWTAFGDVCAQPAPDEDPVSVTCNDGSLFVFHPSDQAGLFFVELRCRLVVRQENKSVSLELLNRFVSFAAQHGGEVKSLRSGVVMPASSGAMLSDLKTSKAFRQAMHAASHPKDKQAL